jgi:hypothetical protein
MRGEDVSVASFAMRSPQNRRWLSTSATAGNVRSNLPRHLDYRCGFRVADCA